MVSFQESLAMLERITENNKISLNRPSETDKIYYSELQQWYTTHAFRSFSVKLVTEACIYYKKDGKEHAVHAGTYMTACKYDLVEAYNRAPIKSICVDICPPTLAETFSVLSGKNEDFDAYLHGYFRYPEFLETVRGAQETATGRQLLQLHQLIRSGARIKLNREWFFHLSERIIYQEYGNYLGLRQIPMVRPSTRKELFLRLQLAKEYMDSRFLQIREISEIARHCGMSEYHFFRRFRELFKQTPFQYLTEQKMQLARQLLLNKKGTVSEIALLCNYPDVFTFSKAFKRFYGFSPSTLK